MSKINGKLLVISSVKVDDDDDADDDTGVERSPTTIEIGDAAKRLDDMDAFNHPRLRRALILQELLSRQRLQSNNDGDNAIDMEFCHIVVRNEETDDKWKQFYSSVHTPALLSFLSNAWERWQISGQDPSAGRESSTGFVLIPNCVPLPRDPWQRPSNHVIGQMGFFCTDDCTPIFGELVQELKTDAAIVAQAVTQAVDNNHNQTLRAIYVLLTHPGHHAAADSFGGYCYVNHVAAAARALQQQLTITHDKDSNKDNDSNNNDKQEPVRVAILDVDYHAGNGTASIFYEDPTVLVVSLHCDPNFDYPFHAGFADQTGHGAGVGSTVHLPMPPQTTWESHYQAVLRQGLTAIQQFTPSAVLVSLGLDTYNQDPCAIRRAGFCLQGKDYKAMGRLLAEEVPPRIPVVFLQEGGYRMDKIGEAATDVVMSFCQHRSVA